MAPSLLFVCPKSCTSAHVLPPAGQPRKGWIKADFHTVHNVERSTFCNRFLLKYKRQAEQISLAVVDYTHFKRKRSQKIDRAIFYTEWKSAYSARKLKYFRDHNSSGVGYSKLG
jgi:hypothetical protein